MRSGSRLGVVGLVTGLLVAACGISLDAAPDDATDSGFTSSSGTPGTSTSGGSTSGGGSASSSGGGSSSGGSTSSSGGGSSSSSSGEACVPITCGPAQCGTVPDNCGSTLDCTCPGGQTCNAGTCCMPQTPAAACGIKCQTNAPDGCGGSVTCGACPGGQVCTGAQTCCTPTPKATACATKCGTGVSDDCGGTYDCGDPCTVQDKVCGGGGVANVCGCESAATTCAGNIDGKPVCKMAKNNCGQAVDCSANVCAPGKTCMVDCKSNDGGQYGCCTP